jgi:hypothetical protein
MFIAIKPIKPIKQAFYHGLIWLSIYYRELDLGNQAKSSLSSQALESSLFVGKSADDIAVRTGPERALRRSNVQYN